ALNNQGLFGGIGTYVKALATDMQAQKQIATQSGFIMDEVVMSTYAASRWTGLATVGPQLTRRLSEATMRLSLMSGHTRAARWAVQSEQVIHLDGQSHVEASREVVSQLLSQFRVGTRLLISGFNDQSAIGALQAARGFGREQDVAIVGQNASDEGRREIRNPDSRLIASIAYFPERYGESLVRVAQSILHRESVPPAVYTEHVVLDRHNVDTYYGRSTETGQNPKW
ncbi:MAG TPA: hypothetical protein PKJ41_14635, partial [Bryobacteraceae bacterium]|nr:hypothetical protein [Bryobacteraceae bacterium]